MPYAVELDLDPASGALVRQLWRALADVGVTWMEESGATPHVSLAIWDRIDHRAFDAELARLAADTRPMPITFDAVGTFPAGAVFLRPVPDPALVDLQRRCHARLSPFAAEPWTYYLPHAWIPHCTLAMDVPPDRMAEVLAVARRAPLPIAGRLEAVGIVEFRPVRLLASHAFG
ncbi:MAG: 2'-5' RNA ligase family protein [Candidatus Rokubacteria bacterium]|nr:2'-5' RNA ligase family protein [Candidatus Rokubacteria bacterium]